MNRVLILMVAITLIFTSCQREIRNKDDLYETEVDTTQNQEYINNLKTTVTVDARYELLAIIQYLADYEVLNEYESAFRNEIEKYFQDYRNHEAVVYFRKLSKNGFNVDAPIYTLLHCSNYPIMTLDEEIPKHITDRSGGMSQLREFVDSMNDFIIDTNFQEFFIQNQERYESYVVSFSDYVDLHKTAKLLEDYYGSKLASYHVILSPMIQGGFGLRLSNSDEGLDAYVIVGPSEVIDNEYSFRNYGIILHEISHSFVNPVVDKYIDQLSESDKLAESHKGKMMVTFYVDWETIVKEYIVRAVVLRFYDNLFSDEYYQGAIEREERMGFKYIRDLEDKLKYYEDNRETYKDFDSFYSELISVFNDKLEIIRSK